LDLFAQLQNLYLASQHPQQASQLGGDAIELEDLLARRQVHADAGGHHIGELTRVLGVEHVGDHVLGQVGGQPHEPAKEVGSATLQRFDLYPLLDYVGVGLDPGPEVWITLGELLQAHALQPLHNDVQCAVGGAGQAMDDCQCADGIDVAWLGLVDLWVLEGNERHQTVGEHGVIDQADRTGLLHHQGEHRQGKSHSILERQDRQLLGNAQPIILPALRRRLLGGAHHAFR